MKKLVVTLAVVITILSFIAGTCLAAEEKAAAAEKPAAKAGKPEKGKAMKMAAVKAPIVKLDRVEIANYWGNLDLEKKTGTVMNLAFVFALENPNQYKVKLDNIKFTVAFEGFDLNTLTNYDPSFIPGKTTNALRVTGAFDATVAQGNLLVTSGHKLQQMNVKAPDLLKKWWDGISDFTFPITINGTANFVGPDGNTIIVPFEGTFPEKK
jgi:hypothetical protein